MHLNVHFEGLAISSGRFPPGGTTGSEGTTPAALPGPPLRGAERAKPVISVNVVLCQLVQDME